MLSDLVAFSEPGSFQGLETKLYVNMAINVKRMEIRVLQSLESFSFASFQGLEAKWSLQIMGCDVSDPLPQ